MYTPLVKVLREVFPEWFSVAEAAAQANGRDTRQLDPRGIVRTWRIGDDLEELVRHAGDCPDTEVLARRVAGHLAGREIPAWEYVVVDVKSPLISVPLFESWQLCNADRTADPALPIKYKSLDLWSPRDLHSSGFGALRRPKTARSLDETAPGEHDLLWPLITLNLLNAAPVRAFTAYLVEPGRHVISRGISGNGYLPAEVCPWHPQPRTLLPVEPYELDIEAANVLSAGAAVLGSCIGALTPADQQIFARAAEHHLYLAYRQGPAHPELDESYVAFRRTVGIEALLTATERDHEGVSRKVAQRAAMLTGLDDDGRLATRDLVREAYAARSAFAHGGGRTRQVDQIRLAELAQMIMRRWLTAAAIHGANKIPKLLDDALISVAARDGFLQGLAARESQANRR